MGASHQSNCGSYEFMRRAASPREEAEEANARHNRPARPRTRLTPLPRPASAAQRAGNGTSPGASRIPPWPSFVVVAATTPAEIALGPRSS